MYSILSVQTGIVAPLGPRRVPSGFVKRPVEGGVEITLRGLAGDEQADLTVHGDAAKAVYLYAAESYQVWRASHPQHAPLWGPGGVAENLTTSGLQEEAVCIGDVLGVGSAVLQVTQPREPCFKLALRFADPLLPKAMVQNGRSGWYCRVLVPGRVAAGDAVTLMERPNPEWPVSRMNRLISAKRPDQTEAAELARLTGLAETWPARLSRHAR